MLESLNPRQLEWSVNQYHLAVEEWRQRWVDHDDPATVEFPNDAGREVEIVVLDSLTKMMIELHTYQLVTPNERILYSTDVEEHVLQCTGLMMKELGRIRRETTKRKAMRQGYSS